MPYSIEAQFDVRPPVIQAIFNRYAGLGTDESVKIMHILNEFESQYRRHTTETFIALQKQFNELLEKQYKETVARYDNLHKK